MNIQSEFRDIHKNKLAFILGAGVSITEADLSLIKPYITMCINESILLYNEPNYYLSCNGDSFTFGLFDKASESKNTTLITPGEFDFEKTYYNGQPYYKLPRKFKEKDCNLANKDDTHLIVGATSTEVGAHLLYIMGCSPIVLLGIDACRLKGYQAFYFMPEYFNILPQKMKDKHGQTYGTFFNSLQANYQKYHYDTYIGHIGIKIWEGFKQNSPDLNIINCSVASKIDCF